MKHLPVFLPCLLQPSLPVSSPSYTLLCFFFHSSFPPLFVVSFLSLPFVLLFASRSAKPHIPYSGLHFTTVLTALPVKQAYLYTTSTPERERAFLVVYLCHTSPFTPRIYTHTPTRKHRCMNPQTELWSVFVYDGERQYRDCFRVVSSGEMYHCQEYVLCV